ncbi:GNAT family N-acetyltransferase [Chitinophaga lutea]
MAHELMTNGYLISDDRTLLQLPVIHRYLSEDSYWAQNVPMEIVEKSVQNSLCFGVYAGGEQVGFARVITDYATFGYLADVFILPAHRGKGLSKRLMDLILSHPELQSLRRFSLMTQDAQSLYSQFGFSVWEYPERFMARRMNPGYTSLR